MDELRRRCPSSQKGAARRGAGVARLFGEFQGIWEHNRLSFPFGVVRPMCPFGDFRFRRTDTTKRFVRSRHRAHAVIDDALPTSDQLRVLAVFADEVPDWVVVELASAQSLRAARPICLSPYGV